MINFNPRNCPDTSGVYIMYGKDGEALYVGKAKNVKNRLSRHAELYGEGKRLLSLLDKDISEKRLAMVVDDLQTFPPIDLFLDKVENVKAANIPFERTEEWEKVLIKKLNPPFNKQHSNGYDSGDYTKLWNKIRGVKKEKLLPEREKRLREAFGEL